MNTPGKKPLKVLLQIQIADNLIDIHRVSAVKADIPTIFIVEKMSDGYHRLTYNAIKIPDLTKVKEITFIRQHQ